MPEKTLLVITGPTGVGKTEVAIQLALAAGTEIVSADSRQLFRDIPIGTAAPTSEELALVKHHFVGILDLEDYYSAAQFEVDVLQLLKSLFVKHDVVVMCGGSMMYVDAVCNGIDLLPTISNEVRQQVAILWHSHGEEALRKELLRLDPDYYAQVDLCNAKRVAHAIEICLQAGVPYSSLRIGKKKPRDFRIIKVALNMPRPLLFDRINRRVSKMIQQGLIDEVKRVYPLRHLNSLNTVGYKEMFAWLDGIMDYDTAVARIAKNTRVYAKKQLTWYAKDPDILWLSPDDASPEFLLSLTEKM